MSNEHSHEARVRNAVADLLSGDLPEMSEIGAEIITVAKAMFTFFKIIDSLPPEATNQEKRLTLMRELNNLLMVLRTTTTFSGATGIHLASGHVFTEDGTFVEGQSFKGRAVSMAEIADFLRAGH